MRRGYVRGPLEVGDGARHLDYPRKRPCGQPHALYQLLQQVFAFVVKMAETLDSPAVHLGVGVYPHVAEALLLPLPGLRHPRRHGRAGLSLHPVHQFAGLHAFQIQLDVYPVHYRPRQAGQVGKPLAGGAGAFVSLAVVAAGARIAGRDEHERSRIDYLRPQPRDAYRAVFDRPSQGLDDAFRRLHHLVEEQDSVVGQRDFPRQDVVAVASPQDCGQRGAVVRGPERALPHEPRSPPLSGNRVYLAGNQRFLHGQRRQNPRQGLCKRALAAPGRTYHNHVVPARDRNLRPAFCALLAYYLREIHVAALQCAAPDFSHVVPVSRCVPDEQVVRRLLLFQDAEHVRNAAHPVNERLPVFYRLHSRAFRQYAACKSAVDGQFGIGEGARDLPHRAVQSQLPHDQILAEPGHGALARGRDNPERDGQVVSAAAFVQVGGRQVDDYLFSRDMEAQRLQRGYGTEQALLHRHVRKAHQVDAYSHRNVHFYRNGYGVDSYSLGADDVD